VSNGRIFNQIDYIAPAAYFRPNGLRTFAILDTNVRIKNIFYSCLDCGFVWGEIDPVKLKKVIIEKATDSTKERLDLNKKQ
tara:strand:+ start:2470 stop:2712 length:243 start_codon:yes stop_codon:yes gene_type:complete